MRYYGFGNYYLSSLQQGLQAAHVIADMGILCCAGNAVEATPTLLSEARAYYTDWATIHKTIVLLNGGNCDDLKELYQFFLNGNCSYFNPYPFAKFNEDEQSLNGAMTSVGIVLPSKIYDTAAIDRRHGYDDVFGKTSIRPTLNDWEEELIVRLNSCGLAK